MDSLCNQISATSTFHHLWKAALRFVHSIRRCLYRVTMSVTKRRARQKIIIPMPQNPMLELDSAWSTSLKGLYGRYFSRRAKMVEWPGGTSAPRHRNASWSYTVNFVFRCFYKSDHLLMHTSEHFLVSSAWSEKLTYICSNLWKQLEIPWRILLQEYLISNNSILQCIYLFLYIWPTLNSLESSTVFILVA